MVKNLSEMQETWVQSLRQEDPLEKEMTTHSSFLAWRFSWTEEPCGVHGVAKQSNTIEQLMFPFFHFSLMLTLISWLRSYQVSLH